MSVSVQGRSYPAVCAGCILFILVLLRPLADVDLFTQIILGRQILSSGALPGAETLVVGREAELTPAIGWLAQVVYASLESNFGISSIRIVNALCYAGAIGILLSGVPQLFPALGAAILTFLAIATSTTPRPQMFAVLLFALTVLLIRGDAGSHKKFVGALSIGILWQNIHPSVPVGIVYAFVDGVARGRAAVIARFPILFGLSIATLLTPDGLRIYELSAQNGFISRSVLGVSEWLPAYDLSVLQAMEGFWLTAILSLPLLYWNWRRGLLEGSWLLAPLLFFLATVVSARFALFFGLTMTLVWSQLLSGVLQRTVQVNRYARMLTGAMVVLSGIVAITISQQSAVSQTIPFDEIRTIVRSLEERGVPAVYNYREWAGPIAYQSDGNIRTVIDGRLYLYDETRWSAYQSEAQGALTVEEITKRYGTNVFILRPSFHVGLIRRLQEDPRCRVTYEAELVVAYECEIALEGSADLSASDPALGAR